MYGHCCQYTVVTQFLVVVPVWLLCAVSGLCTAVVVGTDTVVTQFPVAVYGQRLCTIVVRTCIRL